jgi:deoxyribose-phosphate aldolase
MADQPIQAAGGVVLTTDTAGVRRVLLILDKHGNWTLPKGHCDSGETPEETALREIAEETGIECRLLQPLRRIAYPVRKRGIWYSKQVWLYLAEAPYSVPMPAADEGIQDARWIPASEVLAMIGYDLVREVVSQALESA